MKIWGVIPARYGSTRFPGKPLVSLEGRPLIQWVIESAQKSKKLTDLVVATDDERIQKVVQSLGVKVTMTDSNLPSGTDRVFAACREGQPDAVINIQGDEPLINPQHIDLLAEALSDRSVSMVTLAHPVSTEELKSPNAVKVVCDQNGMALYFSRFAIPYSRHSAEELKDHSGALKHIGMYAYTYEFLEKFCQTPPALIERAESLEQLRALHMGAKIKVIKVDGAAPGVDTPEDLEKIRRML